MNLVFCWIFLYLASHFFVDMTDKNTGNYNDNQPYVVGILSPTTTLYIDETPDNHGISPPNDLNLRRRNTNSFQITSVTVQGSRKNDDLADDSADDLDESHTDDLSSDFLDSSRADNEGYHSEDSYPIADDLSPCGPIIFAHLPVRDPNMNLSIGVTPTFTAIGPNIVAGGVTMMTSKSESPISAQVPIMNPLPDNWQRRFKVVKIVSSEPFRRGRWLCMDFKDPPPNMPSETRPESNGTGTPPIIQITSCDDDGPQDDMLISGNFAQVYEIPIDQTFNGNFFMGSQQHMYGIILPQSEHVQPVTLVQDVSLQTAPLDRNFNVVNNSTSILVQAVDQEGLADPAYPAVNIGHPATLINDNGIPDRSPPSSQSANNNDYSTTASQTVLNQINSNDKISQETPVAPPLAQSAPRTSLDSNNDNPPSLDSIPAVQIDKLSAGTEDSESFSYLVDELSRTSGLPRRPPLSGFGANGHCCSPPLQPKAIAKVAPTKPLILPPISSVANSTSACVSVAPPISAVVADVNSSQTAPEKIPSEVGQEVDPSAGSAASTGANTVAIDNKIEQAMDLVKSHLMFAVREEVEVLKEKITELLERISQLEHENDILRANASAETLKQLNNQSHKKNTSGGTTGKPQQVAPVPPST